MKYPHMTPKRWFWSYMTAGLIWCGAGTRWDVAWMKSLQANVIEQPVRALLIVSYVFTATQQMVYGAVRGTNVRDGNESLNDDALRGKVIELENSLAQERALNREYAGQLAAMNQLQLAGIAPDSVMQATVIGYQAGPGTSMLMLDKGRLRGVAKGAPVLFASVGDDDSLKGVTLLGRVDTVFELECRVQLLSDPGSRVRAQIVRPQGDPVQLIDNQVPPQAQYMALGQLHAVSTRADQPLRYSLHVTPRVAVTSLHTVMILTK